MFRLIVSLVLGVVVTVVVGLVQERKMLSLFSLPNHYGIRDQNERPWIVGMEQHRTWALQSYVPGELLLFDMPSLEEMDTPWLEWGVDLGRLDIDEVRRLAKVRLGWPYHAIGFVQVEYQTGKDSKVFFPYWPGLLADIALYSIISFVIWTSVRGSYLAIRRRMRQNQSRCTNCGYAGRGSTNQCPECGSQPQFEQALC